MPQEAPLPGKDDPLPVQATPTIDEAQPATDPTLDRAEADTAHTIEGLPPETLGRFALAGEIGRGGMGCVLRGHDPDLDRDLAIKVLLPTHRGQAHLERRFLEEARIAGRLEHPGVPPVYELGRAHDDRPFFAMKFIRGQTLAKLLRERLSPQYDLPHFLAVFEQVCQTLAYAHAHGVIHRDLKPANIMVGKFGEVQVMDWGLAKVLAEKSSPVESDAGEPSSVMNPTGEALSQAGSVLGTPAYMAPEQARGQIDKLDERADVFGLGAILCTILTGSPPFARGETSVLIRRSARGEVGDAFSRLDICGADGDLVSLAKDCLAAEVCDRPRHGGEVAQRVTAYRAGVEQRLRAAEVERAAAQARAKEAKAKVHAEKRARQLTLALAACVLALVGVGGGGYAWVQHQHANRREATGRIVEESLQKASLLRGRAATGGELSAWNEALAEAQHAEELLTQGEADPALRDRILMLREELQQCRDEAQRRADDARAERLLVERLEAIRGKRGEEFNPAQADRAFADAFRAFGLDLDVVAPTKAGAKLARRAATAEIAAALDLWYTLRRVDPARSKDESSWQRLAVVAREADPDPWRNGLRATFNLPLAKRTRVLRKQAEDAAALEKQPVASLILLGQLLYAVQDRTRMAAVLRAAWRRFPGDFWVNIELGKASWSSNRYQEPEEALRFFTAAVAARPRSPLAHNVLGIVLGQQQKGEEALACFHKAIELDPRHPAGHTNLGAFLCDFKRDYNGAIACFHKALAIDPKDHRARTNLGNALAKQGKRDEAIAAYRQAIDLDPKYASAYLGLGLQLGRQGKWTEGMSVLRKGIALDPKEPRAHCILGNALGNRGKTEEAIVAYRKAIALDPRFFPAHADLGTALRKQGKDVEAIAAYRKAIALDPRHAKVSQGLGDALLSQEKLEEAIAVFRQTIRLDPNLPEGHAQLGVALARQGKVKEAIACYRKAIALDPMFAEAHTYLGLALSSQGNRDEAMACFRKAIAIDPHHALANNNLGLALVDQGKLDEAIATYRKAIAGDPNLAAVHGNLGIALSRQGKADEAIAAFRKAIALDPKTAGNYSNLGISLSHQGKVEEAIAAFRRAIALDPNLVWPYYYLGNALLSQRKLDDAGIAYRKAIALNPKHAESYCNLGHVLKDQGKFAESLDCLRRGHALGVKRPGWSYPSALWVRRAERLAALEKKLPAFRKGEYKPADNKERFTLAQVCKAKRLYHTATRLYSEAFLGESKQANVLNSGHRNDAACCAALAATGQGEDATALDDKERARLRGLGLTWLHANLELYRLILKSANPTESAVLQSALRNWQQVADLAGLRDREALVKLPAAERQACEKFWADVEVLRKKTQPKPVTQ